MDQGICMSQIVEESIAQSFAFMCTRDKTGDIQQFDGDRSLAIDASAVVGFTFLSHATSGACAIDLEVPHGTLRVYRGEAGACLALVALGRRHFQVKSSYGKLPAQRYQPDPPLPCGDGIGD